MIIYIVTFLVSFVFCSIAEKSDKKCKGKKANIYYLFAILMVSILAGVRDFSIGTDIATYGHWLFRDARYTSNLYNFVTSNSVIDIGYSILVYIVAIFFENEHWLYFFTGLIIYGFTLLGLRKYSKYCSVSWAWLNYLFLLYSDSLNTMRQCMAVAVIIWSFDYFIQKKYKEYVFATLLAISFHSTAIISFVIAIIYWIINKQNRLLIKSFVVLGTEIALVYYSYILEILIRMGLLNEKYERYMSNSFSIGSLNPILVRIPFLVVIILFYKPFIYRNKEQNYDSESIYYSQANIIGEFVILMLIIEMLTAQMRGINSSLYRIALYFTIFRCIAMGRLVEILSCSNRKIIKIILFVMLLIIWIYQNVIQGNNEIYPYTSELIGIG